MHFLLLTLLSAPLAHGTARLTVTITNVRNDAGVVLCSVFANAKGFPGKSPFDDGQRSVKAARGEVTCAFEAMPAGELAVSVTHDENVNGATDTNFLGIPTEGYGVSNNVLPALSKPTFDDAKFVLHEGEVRALKVTLKY